MKRRWTYLIRILSARIVLHNKSKMIFKSHYFKITAFIICLISFSCYFKNYAAADFEKKTIRYDGKTREYFIYVPSSYNGKEHAPLLMVFHGGGGKAENFARFTGFDNLSEKYGFISVYPEGIEGHWNDGRESEKFKAQDKEIDDIAFVIVLLEKLQSSYNIDKNQIFATGMSNGGVFCQRLAAEQPQHFAAVASVTAQIAEPLSKRFNPQEPISVLIMNGTRDPLMPYSGGEVKDPDFFPLLSRFRQKPSRGRVLSTDETIRLWLKHDQIATPPITDEMPDLDNDKVTVERKEWKNRDKGVSVVLYKINGGGHTWPGGKQYLPEKIIGKTCMDIQASEVIWDFFSKNKKQGSLTNRSSGPQKVRGR